LARIQQGLELFKNFAQSYRNYPAGISHDLFIICKGFSKQEEFEALQEIFQDIPHKIIPVEDDIGMDLAAYKDASDQVTHPYVCFLNTYSRINSDNWLQKFFSHCEKEDVGLVGATGSFESLYDSSIHLLGNNLFLLLLQRKKISIFFCHLKNFFLRKIFKRHLSDTFNLWRMNTKPDSFWHFINWIPSFPNPHIRSNAFMLRLKDWQSITEKKPLKTKVDSVLLESGIDSLSDYFLRQGRKILLVGSDGKGYSPLDWPEGGFFRSKNQENLLIKDNHTDCYLGASKSLQTLLHHCTWGDYVFQKGQKNLENFSFPQNPEKLKPQPQMNKPPFFSIVIPTHNRPECLMDALKTIMDQDYSHWEVVIFDNASEQPIAPLVEKLKDQRIRCERSDEKLWVTESWNKAVSMARGDYITFIGDDDGLCPHFFQNTLKIIKKVPLLDLVCSSIYSVIFSDASTGQIGSTRLLSLPYPFLKGENDTFYPLHKHEALQILHQWLKNSPTIYFAMPAFTIKRSLLQKIQRNGQVFHSNFPDYYFAGMAFAEAEKIVLSPQPLAFQGVSPRSVGGSLLKGEKNLFRTLNFPKENPTDTKNITKFLVPGWDFYTELMITLHKTAQNLGLPHGKSYFRRYQRIQLIYLLTIPKPTDREKTKALLVLFPKLFLREKLFFCKVSFACLLFKIHLNKRILRTMCLEYSPIPKANLITYNDKKFVSGQAFYQQLKKGL
jgi:glycosyltransferase involved in cell wall biosynthesis